MCGGFRCLRNVLIALNILYIVLGVVLIYVSAHDQFTFSYSGNLNAANWIENCGFLLICLAVMGSVAAVKHHQISLFFYMFILAAIILVQIIVSIACIVTKDSQLKSLATDSWTRMDTKTKHRYMLDNGCCTFDETLSSQMVDFDRHCASLKMECCTSPNDALCNCPTCTEKLLNALKSNYQFAGKVGVIFIFIEILGIFLTIRYRNQKDPRAQTSEFL